MSMSMHAEKIYIITMLICAGRKKRKNWSMHSIGIVNRVCSKTTPIPTATHMQETKRGGWKTWKWNNRNQNGFKYNTWRHCNTFVHITERLLFKPSASQSQGYFIYTHWDLFILLAIFFNGLPPFFRSFFPPFIQ